MFRFVEEVGKGETTVESRGGVVGRVKLSFGVVGGKVGGHNVGTLTAWIVARWTSSTGKLTTWTGADLLGKLGQQSLGTVPTAEGGRISRLAGWLIERTSRWTGFLICVIITVKYEIASLLEAVALALVITLKVGSTKVPRVVGIWNI